MGKLYTKARKFDPTRVLIKKVHGEKHMKNYDGTHIIGESLKKQSDATEEAKKAAQAAANEPVIPMADDEELARIRRRRASRSRGSRSSTDLTGDTFGSGS
jgi:hypothetical protein